MAMMSPLRVTAYDWHGGGGSPLYSFASCGGKVHSEEHREQLIQEIEDNIEYCKSVPPEEESGINGPAESASLNALLEHVRAAEVGVEIEDSRTHSDGPPYE